MSRGVRDLHSLLGSLHSNASIVDRLVDVAQSTEAYCGEVQSDRVSGRMRSSYPGFHGVDFECRCGECSALDTSLPHFSAEPEVLNVHLSVVLDVVDEGWRRAGCESINEQAKTKGGSESGESEEGGRVLGGVLGRVLIDTRCSMVLFAVTHVVVECGVGTALEQCTLHVRVLLLERLLPPLARVLEPSVQLRPALSLHVGVVVVDDEASCMLAVLDVGQHVAHVSVPDQVNVVGGHSELVPVLPDQRDELFVAMDGLCEVLVRVEDRA